MICFILSCKHIEDWVAKTAFLEKENLADFQTSIGVGDENLIPT